MKRDYDALKNSSTAAAAVAAAASVSNTFIIPPQRFRPLEANNYTTKSIASLFQDSRDKLNNLAKEVKPQVVAAALDTKDKVLNALGLNGNSSTTPIVNQQDSNNGQNQQQVGQNVPAPPLAGQAQQQQQAGHVESAQAAPPPPPAEPSKSLQGNADGHRLIFSSS